MSFTGRGGSSPLLGTLVKRDLRQFAVSPFFVGLYVRCSGIRKNSEPFATEFLRIQLRRYQGLRIDDGVVKDC